MPIGRLFFEISGDTSKLNASLREAIKTAEDASVKITRAGQSFVAKFDEALNPTQKLAEQIQLLAVAGRSQALNRLGREMELADLTGSIAKLNAQLGNEEGGPFTEAILRAGEPLSYVSAQLEHKSPDITLRVYSHWIPGTKRSAMHVLDCRSAENPQKVPTGAGR